jgi:DHA1 family inner membrane transport protein
MPDSVPSQSAPHAARFVKDVLTLSVSPHREGQPEPTAPAERADHTAPADHTPPAEQFGAADWWLLSAVCLAPFVTQLATFALSPFLPFIAEDLGSTVSVLGQIPALALFTAATLGLLVGPLADRLGHRPTLLAGVLASSLGAVATALAPSLLVLVPVALIGAGGRSIGLPVSQAIVGTRYAGPALRRGLGLVQATGTLAPIVGIPLVTAIGTLTGWRGAFLALGALGFLAIGLMLRLLPPDRVDERDARTLSPVAFAPLLRDRPSVCLYASSLIRNIGVWAWFTYCGAFLVETYGLSAAEVGWAFTATGIGNFVGSMATGGPLGRVSLRGLAIAAPVLIGGCLGATTIFSAGLPPGLPGGSAGLPLGLPLVVVLMTLGFVGNGVGIVSQNTLLVDGSPAGRATTTSLNQTCMSLGGAIGSSAGGLLLAAGGFPSIGLLTLGCNLLAAACLLPARRVRPRS